MGALYTVCSLFAICSSAILGGFRALIPADRTRRRPSPAAVRNRVVRIRDCCALCVETARRIAHALRRGRLRTPPKVPCKERNKELAPFGRWCDPTVSAPGEAPLPQPREFDPSLPPPVWICPTCERPMRARSIEVANGEEHIKLACGALRHGSHAKHQAPRLALRPTSVTPTAELEFPF